MPETRAAADAAMPQPQPCHADDVELPAADPATAPPPHVIVRIPNVDDKSDGGRRRRTAVEKPPSLYEVIEVVCFKALMSILYIGAVIVSLYFFVQAVAASTWVNILL